MQLRWCSEGDTTKTTLQIIESDWGGARLGGCISVPGKDRNERGLSKPDGGLQGQTGFVYGNICPTVVYRVCMCLLHSVPDKRDVLCMGLWTWWNYHQSRGENILSVFCYHHLGGLLNKVLVSSIPYVMWWVDRRTGQWRLCLSGQERDRGVAEVFCFSASGRVLPWGWLVKCASCLNVQGESDVACLTAFVRTCCWRTNGLWLRVLTHTSMQTHTLTEGTVAAMGIINREIPLIKLVTYFWNLDASILRRANTWQHK